MTGFYWIFANAPLWVIAGVLYFTTDVAMHVGRDWLEGLGYQVAWSAKIGDGVLFITVLMIAAMFQDGRALHIPGWLQLASVHAWFIMACFALGGAVSVLTIGSRSGQVMDIYHDIVIAPALLYLAVTLLPIVVYNAKWWEWVVVLVATAIYIATVI